METPKFAVIHLLFLLELWLIRWPNFTSKRRQQSTSVSCPLGKSQGGLCEKVSHRSHRKSWFEHSQRCEPGTQASNNDCAWTGAAHEAAHIASVGGELRSAGLSASLALRLNLWPITHCAEPIRQERTLPLVLRGQFARRLRRCAEWADAFWEAEKNGPE